LRVMKTRHGQSDGRYSQLSAAQIRAVLPLAVASQVPSGEIATACTAPWRVPGSIKKVYCTDRILLGKGTNILS